MRVEIINGPSLESIQAAQYDMKTGRIPGLGMAFRDAQGHEFKIFGEPTLIYRMSDADVKTLDKQPEQTGEPKFYPIGGRNINSVTFAIDIKHANVGGKDKDCPAAKAFLKEVKNIIYNVNAGTGYVDLDI